MNDEIRMGIGDSIKHLREEPDATANVDTAGVAPIGDPFALHHLQGEPGLAARRHASVMQAGNVRMVQ